MNSDEIDIYKLNPEFCKLGLNYKRNLAIPSIEYINCSKKQKRDQIWESPNHYVYSNLSKGSYRDIISTYKKTYITKYSRKINISTVISKLQTLYSSDPIWILPSNKFVLNYLIGKFPDIANDYSDVFDFENYNLMSNELSDEEALDSLLNQLLTDEKYKLEIDNFNKNLYIVNYFKKTHIEAEFFNPGVLIVDDYLNPANIKISKNYSKYRIFKLKQTGAKMTEDEIYKEWNILKSTVNIDDEKIAEDPDIYLQEKEKEKREKIIHDPYLIFYNEEIIKNGDTWLRNENSNHDISKIIKKKWEGLDNTEKQKYRDKYKACVDDDNEKTRYIDAVTAEINKLKGEGKYTKSDYDSIYSLKNPFVESPYIEEKINIHDTKLGIESVYSIYNQRYKNICILEAIKKYIICILDQYDSQTINQIIQDIKLKKSIIYDFNDKLIGKDGYNSIGYMLMEIIREKSTEVEDPDLSALDDNIYSCYLASLILKYRVKSAISIMEYKGVSMKDISSQIDSFDIQKDTKENVVKNYRLKILKEYNYIRLQLHFGGNAMLEYIYDKYFIKAFDRVKYHREKSIVDSYIMNKLLGNCDNDEQSTSAFFEDINSKYGDVRSILNAMVTPVILDLGNPACMILKHLDTVKDEIYDNFKYSILNFYNPNIDNPCFIGATEDVDYSLMPPGHKHENQPPLPVDLKFIYYSINSNKNIVSVDLDRTYLDFLITVNNFNIFTKKEEELEKRRILSEIKDRPLAANYNRTVRELYNEGLFPPTHLTKNIKTKYDKYDNNINRSNIDKYKKYLRIHKNYTKSFNANWANWITPAINFSTPLILDTKNDIYEIKPDSIFSFTFTGPRPIKIDGFEFNSMYQYVHFNLLKKYPPYIEIPSDKKLYKDSSSMRYNESKTKVEDILASEIVKTKEKLYQLSLLKKFEDDDMKDMLLKTGTKKIVYGSNDPFFGWKKGKGMNIIGDLYETIRENLSVSFLSSPKGEDTILNSVLLNVRLFRWVSDRISRFVITIDILKNISVNLNYKEILKIIYTFCSFKKNINITNEINEILSESNSDAYRSLLKLKENYMNMINNPADIKTVEYLSKLFNKILTNVVSILDSFIKNKKIKDIDVLINSLNEVNDYNFFSNSLPSQLYNYIMSNHKKGQTLPDILKNFTYKISDPLNDSFEEIEFDISIPSIKEDLDKYKIPTQPHIKPNNSIELCILKLTYFIISKLDLESVELIIGFLPQDLYKKYIIGNSLIQISESIIQNIENQIDPAEAIEKAASILLCKDISSDESWLSFQRSSDELFKYTEDPDLDSVNIKIDKINLNYADFYFSGQDDKPIVKKYYDNCNLTSLVEFVYSITTENFILLNRILCFSRSSHI